MELKIRKLVVSVMHAIAATAVKAHAAHLHLTCRAKAILTPAAAAVPGPAQRAVEARSCS